MTLISDGENIRLAIDATPLLGKPTGIGSFVGSLLQQILDSGDGLLPLPYALSFRGGNFDLDNRLPTSLQAERIPLPAAALLRIWRHLDMPTLNQLGVPADVAHGTNFVVPPGAKGSVVTVHDLTSVRFPELCSSTTLRYPKLIQRAINRGSFVHTPTEAVANEVREHFQVHPHQVRAVHHGLNAIPDTKVDLKSITGDANFVLATGTIEPRKDYAMLVKAFDQIAAKHDGLQLLIVGERGWRTEAFDDSLRNAQHKDRIRLLGYTDDETRFALLRAARVLAYPSLYEGFGLPPLEAMQCSVPVVTTDVPAIREVCGSAPLFAPIRDDKSFAEALNAALSDEALREDLVERGRSQATRYDWGLTLKQLMALYREAYAAGSQR